MKKSFTYKVYLWKKGEGSTNYICKDVTLQEGQNFWLVFYNLMQEHKCNKYHATITGYTDPVNYIPYPFRWTYYN